MDYSGCEHLLIEGRGALVVGMLNEPPMSPIGPPDLQLQTRIKPMKSSVDAIRCQGHGRRHALVPDLFDLDDDGNASACGSEISEDRRADAALAVANGPENAISVGWNNKVSGRW